MPCNQCQQYHMVENSDVVRYEDVLPGYRNEVDGETYIWPAAYPGSGVVPVSNVDRGYVQLPGACDSGDAFWWFVGGALVGGLATFAVVAVTNERTIKGVAKKAASGMKKMFG